MKLRNSLIINLITVLHKNGVPAHRLENSVKKVAKKIKFNVFLNIGLNSITISIDEHDLQFVKIINFDSTNLNLSKIHEVNHLISKFCNNQLTLDEFNDQQSRLLHAKEHAYLYLMTDGLTPEQVRDAVILYIDKFLA